MKLSFAFGWYRKIGRRQGEKLSLKIRKAGQVNCSAFRLLVILFFEMLAYLQFESL